MDKGEDGFTILIVIMQEFNFRDYLLNCTTKQLLSIANKQDWTLYFRSDMTIYKCRIKEIYITMNGIKLVVKRIIYGDEFILSLDDYNVSWSDNYHSINRLHQISLFELADMCNQKL